MECKGEEGSTAPVVHHQQRRRTAASATAAAAAACAPGAQVAAQGIRGSHSDKGDAAWAHVEHAAEEGLDLLELARLLRLRRAVRAIDLQSVQEGQRGRRRCARRSPEQPAAPVLVAITRGRRAELPALRGQQLRQLRLDLAATVAPVDAGVLVDIRARHSRLAARQSGELDPVPHRTRLIVGSEQVDGATLSYGVVQRGRRLQCVGSEAQWRRPQPLRGKAVLAGEAGGAEGGRAGAEGEEREAGGPRRRHSGCASSLLHLDGFGGFRVCGGGETGFGM